MREHGGRVGFRVGVTHAVKDRRRKLCQPLVEVLAQRFERLGIASGQQLIHLGHLAHAILQCSDSLCAMQFAALRVRVDDGIEDRVLLAHTLKPLLFKLAQCEHLAVVVLGEARKLGRLGVA